MRHMRRVAAILACTALLGACGDGTETSVSDATSELNAAIDRTLQVESLHIEMSSTAPDAGGTASVDYNAPDRIRTVSEDGTESIVIGDTVYFSDFAEPGRFLSTTRPGASPARNLFVLLEAVQDAESIEVEGEEFVASLGDKAGTARLRVRDGYVVRLRLQSGSGDERIDVTHGFSRFGSAAEVAAPPPEQVSEAPTTPECPEDGEVPEGVLACSGGDMSEPEDVDLPAPSEPSDSTLQFRPVRSDAPAGCAASEDNPPAESAAVLADSEGQCLDLEAAGLEIEGVEELHATRQGEDIMLSIKLSAADARRFDEIAEANLGERLALVTFGRVVSAPTIQATEFDGQLAISGLSMDEAARVNAALT